MTSTKTFNIAFVYFSFVSRSLSATQQSFDVQTFAVDSRYYVDREAETRDELASAKLDVRHGAALELVECQRAAAKKAREAALRALAEANRAVSICDNTITRLSSLRCGAAWGWPAAEGVGVRVYRPLKGGVSRVFARLLIG